MKISKLPVTLVTGFLGSGKTTFLNNLIRHQSTERILVVENEVGQTNIDGALVEVGVEDVVELTAGCLCCSLSDELLDTLELVSARQDEIDRLVIETTGVADPSSIVQVFLSDPRVGKYFDLEHVICVVDAELVEEWLEETEEALRQIVMANVILLNKVDTVSAIYVHELTQKIKEINPHSLAVSGEQGLFPFDKILQTKTSDVVSFEGIMMKLESNDTPQEFHSHKVNTFTLTFQNPFILEDTFSLQLYRLVNLYRHQVYRIKGILDVVGYPNRVILQSVRTNFVLTDGSEWMNGDKRESKLVFIGRGLKKEAFIKMFNHYTQKLQNESI